MATHRLDVVDLIRRRTPKQEPPAEEQEDTVTAYHERLVAGEYTTQPTKTRLKPGPKPKAETPPEPQPDPKPDDDDNGE